MKITHFRSGPRAGGIIVALATLLVPTPAIQAQEAIDIESRVAMDLAGLGTGIVAGVVSGGELDFLEAWGTPSSEATDSLDVSALFAFPALTEILIAMTVRALGDAGQLDLAAPLSSYDASWTGRLGRATLDQLLSHTAGLYNGALPAGRSWAEALAAIDDDWFVAEPGEVYSNSRYSYPLAALVLERRLNAPLTEIASSALLEPLGMNASTFDPDTARAWGLATGYSVDSTGLVAVEPVATLNGLPVIYTTAPNVLQLLSAWMDGGIRGSVPVRESQLDVARLDPTRVMSDGIVQEVSVLVPYAWSTRRDAGFGTAIHMYPEQRAAMFVWGNAAIPANTMTWIRQALADAVGDIETSLAGQGVAVTRTIEAEAVPAGLDDLEAWAGLYRNGAALFGLRYRDGRLFSFDGTQDVELIGQGPATFAPRRGNGLGPPMQLIQIGDRRMVLFGNLAYQWESPTIPPQ